MLNNILAGKRQVYRAMSPSTRSNGRSTRRGFLGVVGGVCAATAGCVGTGSDPEPRGREISVPWELDPESTGEYEHFQTLRDEERGWTWFEGRFVATDSDVVGFDYELTFRRDGEVIDRWRSEFEPAEYSSMFVMDPGEGTTYEYPVRDAPVPTSFEVLVQQMKEEKES